MVKLISSAVVILLSAGCATPQPQPEPRETERTVLRVQAPPVYALLGEREELRLSSEQVAAIDSIGRWLHAANAPHLLVLNGQPGERSERTNAEEDTLLALLQTIDENNSSAGEAVEELLNDTQEAQVCEMFAESRKGARETREMRRRGAFTDSIIGALTVWPWCGRP